MGEGLIRVSALNSARVVLNKCNEGESNNRSVKSKKPSPSMCGDTAVLTPGPSRQPHNGSQGWMSWSPGMVAFLKLFFRKMPLPHLSQRTSVFEKAHVNSPKLKTYRAKYNFPLKRKWSVLFLYLLDLLLTVPCARGPEAEKLIVK